MDFIETDEQKALRAAVAELGKRYGHEYVAPRARTHEPLTELWAEAGQRGFLGVNLPGVLRRAAARACTSWRSWARSSTPPAAGC